MSPVTILIVDDQPSVLAAVGHAVAALFPQLRILLSTSAEEAWELVRHQRPDIVLSDIMMPSGMSGLELCDRIKAEAGLQQTYIILMTAFTTQEWQLKPNSRPDALLRKPFHVLELREKLEAALRTLELRRSRALPEVEPSADDVRTFVAELVQLRSPQLGELADNLSKAADWLSQHVEELSESDRSFAQWFGYGYVLGRLTLPDFLLHEPLCREGHLSHELMLQVPLGAAMVCQHHPRLASLVPILASLAENWDGSGFPEHRRAWEIPLAARLFRLAVDFEELLWLSPQPPTLVAAYLERYARQAYDAQLLPLVSQYAQLRESRSDILAVGLHELQAGMVLAHDLRTRTGLTLATAGTVLTHRLIERLWRLHANDPIVGAVLIRHSAEPP